MPIQFDKFDQQKVDNIFNHLEASAKKGTPKPYEVHVDGVKAVMKTEDPNEFYRYEDYMKENTDQVKFIIYGSNNSPRNDQYAFSMKAKTQNEALELGLDGFATKAYSQADIKEMVAKRQKQLEELEELERLRLKVKEQEKQLEENKITLETMQKIIDKAKENGNKINGYHMGDLLSVAIEGLLRRNAKSIADVTGLEGFAQVFSGREGNAAPQEENEGASFKRKGASESPEPNEHEKNIVAFFTELEKIFSPQEMDQIVSLLEGLAKDKNKLAIVLEAFEGGEE